MRHSEPGHHRRGGGRPGARRLFDYGDLRLMTLALVADQPRNGYQIIKEIGLRFDGAYAPSPGAIYPVIAWLEDMNLVTIAPADGAAKQVSATAAGRPVSRVVGAAIRGPVLRSWGGSAATRSAGRPLGRSATAAAP